jgi:hypothetical protein
MSSESTVQVLRSSLTKVSSVSLITSSDKDPRGPRDEAVILKTVFLLPLLVENEATVGVETPGRSIRCCSDIGSS